jgi:integrase
MGKRIAAKGKRSSNDGSIYLAPNGKWRCMLSLGKKEDGTRNRISRYFDCEKEARAWKTQQLATVLQYGNESVKTVSGLFVPQYHKWLLEVKMPDVLSQHFNALMIQYNKYIKPYFLKAQQKDLNVAAFQKFFRYLEQKNVGHETQRKMKCALRQYFEKEFANTPMRNPLDSVKLTVKKTEVIINPDEIIAGEEYKAVPKEVRKQFLEALDRDKFSRFLKPLCYLMYFTGNRVGETLAYQWKDFNFEKRYILVYKAATVEYDFDENGNKIGKAKTIIKQPKTKKGIRPLPLLDILCEVLQEWFEYRKAQEKVLGISFTAPDDYVFSNNKGELRSRWGANTLLARFLERNNLQHQGIHFHALRQTFSNSLFAEESDDKLITDLMGHAKISTSKEHYNSIEKFDSVQRAALMFNARYKPKDLKYCADESVTFTPDGYITEQESITVKAVEVSVTKERIVQPAQSEQQKRPLVELLTELSSYPEFQELLKKMSEQGITTR